MAYMRDIQIRGDGRDAKQVMNYLRQLEEQIRYALSNLDGENIQAGAIGEAQLSTGVQGRLSSAERSVEQITEAQSQLGATLRRILGTVDRIEAYSARSMEGTLPFRILVSETAPGETGVLWFQPGAETDGKRPCQAYYIPEAEE